MKLSVLDQSMIAAGRTGADAIRESVDLARHCDALGFHRYWVSEHHNSEAVGGSAPEVLLAALAMVTRRIRLGSAGVMLPHYAALHVAEQFRVLEALAPGRIDLGVGRAPGSDRLTAAALNPNPDVERFPLQIRDMMQWMAGEPLVEGHPFRSIVAQPAGPGVPEVWVLGSSDYGAQVAAHFGLPYCFAHFFTDGQGAAEAVELYRSLYRPSARHPEPYAALCVWAFAGESSALVEREWRARGVWRLARDRGAFVAYPSAEDAARPLSLAEEARVSRGRERALVGSGAEVAAGLMRLGANFGVQELAVLSTAHDPEVRRRSYGLIAAAAGLDGALRAAA